MKAPQIKTFEFYDTETSGIDPRYDQVYQFASVKTDTDLNLLEGGTSNIICRPRLDVVPHPKAFLTHKLDVDALRSEGVNEWVLARMVQNIFMAEPGTAVSGYNTSRFDNEVTRNLLFRNMKGMYDHEWKNNNLTFDVFKLVQLVYALRPELLSWREKEDGKTSLKLEHLSADNGIAHVNAHDALDDVYATIGVAKVIKEANPRIFAYALAMCLKDNPKSLISKREPLIHVDTVHGQDKAISTLIQPLAIDKSNKNKFICLDLRTDPRPLMEMSPEDINRYMFTKREDLPEDSPKIPLVFVQANKQPMISEASIFASQEYLDRANIDWDDCMRNLEYMKSCSGLASKVQDAMECTVHPEPNDPYATIYTGGFLSNDDQRSRAQLHMTSDNSAAGGFNIESVDVHGYAARMDDSIRHFDLILRGKWNSFYDKLLSEEFSPTEFTRWVDYLESRLVIGIDDKALTIAQFYEEVSMVELETPLSAEDKEILDKVVSHIREVERTLNELRELAKDMKDEASKESQTSPTIKLMNRKLSTLLRNEDDSYYEQEADRGMTM